MLSIDEAISAAFKAVVGRDPHEAPAPPPDRTIPFATLKDELRDGYGVEDIAAKHDLDPDHVRAMVGALRQANRLRFIYPRKGRAFVPSFFAWIGKGEKA